MNTRSKKKIWAVYHEIRHWWYFGPIWSLFAIEYVYVLITVELVQSTPPPDKSPPTRAQPAHQVVSIFFLPSMNTTKVSIFSATIFVNTTQNSNNNQWNPGHKNKKIWAVYHEIRHWWYFGPIWVCICYWIRLRFN